MRFEPTTFLEGIANRLAAPNFPSSASMAEASSRALSATVPNFNASSPCERLLRLHEYEYEIFREIERKRLVGFLAEMAGPLAGLRESSREKQGRICDDISAAMKSMHQRRMSRAGRSLEIHAESILRQEGIPFVAQRAQRGGIPDILVPGPMPQATGEFPVMLAIKRTVRERYRQEQGYEGIGRTYILTIDRDMSDGQLRQMHSFGFGLVVPEPILGLYPKGFGRGIGIPIVSFTEFIGKMAAELAVVAKQ